MKQKGDHYSTLTYRWLDSSVSCLVCHDSPYV